MGPAEILDALANQIQAQLSDSIGTADPLIDDLQVYQRMTWNPTPPTIDMYPGDDPFQEQVGMGRGNNALYFTVRARVNTPEHEGAQDLLLAMMDPQDSLSVSAAITAAGTASPAKTLGGVVESVSVEGPSNFGIFTDPGPTAGSLLGCTWRVQVLP
jgi:hypothetical protein